MAPHDRVVVVGGGIAGWSCVAELRRLGFRGHVDVVSREGSQPYERPPLSKKYLTGEWDVGRLQANVRVSADDGPVDVHPNTVATGIDITNREIKFSSGGRLPYTHAVIATGAQPRVPGDLQGHAVHVLRTQADADSLRTSVVESGQVCIVGGGFIGLEVAATCLSMGVQATVIEPYPAVLASRVGDVAAQRLVARHNAEGVHLRLGTALAADGPIDADGRIRLDTGEVFEPQPILVATGASPWTDWLAGSGLSIEDGVTCDEFGEAAPGVWAAGDVARWYHGLYHQHMRVEHRLNAAGQGRVVAQNILGAAIPWTEVPLFWTDQFDIRLQVLGRLTPEHRPEVVEGDPDADAFLIVFTHGSKPPAIVAWNAGARLAVMRRELGLAD